MKRSNRFAWRHRRAAVALLVLAGALAVGASQALADSSNPIAGTTKGTLVVNPPGTNGSPAGCTEFGTAGTPVCTVTVYMRGQYNWLTNDEEGGDTNDCNTNRAATGVALIWNDPTEPGFSVRKGSIVQNVGVKTLRSGDTVNVVDEMVHPADIGNVAEGYPGLPSQVFKDPAPGITSAQLAAWKGGCGREPITATASPGPGTAADPTGKTCADGTKACANYPWGSWGYQVNSGQGYSHTFAKRTDVSNVCVNMYDMHVGGPVGSPNFQIPGGTGDITVDKNDDNSIQQNNFNPTGSDYCVSFALAAPSIATALSPGAAVQVGTAVHDTATLTGATATAGGTVTYTVYPKLSDCTAGTNGTAAGTVTVANGAVPSSTTITPATGGYFWQAVYSGDLNNSPAASACSSEPLAVVDAYVTISPPSATNPLNATHTMTAKVFVNAGDGAGYVAAPNGTVVTFTLLPGSVASFKGGTTCTLASGSCTISTSSSVVGTDTVQAAATVTVAGVALTRTTAQAAPGHANSANAVKHWESPPPPPTPTVKTNPSISIVKDPQSQTISTGGTAKFAITVTNTGDVTLTNVTVTDPKSPDCARDLGTLAAGASRTFTCTRDDVTVSFENVATATGKPPTGPNVSDDDNADVKVAPFTPPSKPLIAVVKSPKLQWLTTRVVTTGSGTTAKTTVSYGTATFTIVVTNKGDTPLTAVTVNDPQSPDCNRSLGTLAPGASRTYSCSLTEVKRNFTNVATASGQPPAGSRISAADSADVRVKVKTTSTAPAKFTG